MVSFAVKLVVRIVQVKFELESEFELKAEAASARRSVASTNLFATLIVGSFRGGHRPTGSICEDSAAGGARLNRY